MIGCCAQETEAHRKWWFQSDNIIIIIIITIAILFWSSLSTNARVICPRYIQLVIGCTQFACSWNRVHPSPNLPSLYSSPLYSAIGIIVNSLVGSAHFWRGERVQIELQFAAQLCTSPTRSKWVKEHAHNKKTTHWISCNSEWAWYNNKTNAREQKLPDKKRPKRHVQVGSTCFLFARKLLFLWPAQFLFFF